LGEIRVGLRTAAAENLPGEIRAPPAALAIDVDEDHPITLTVGAKGQAFDNRLCGADRHIVLTGAAAEDNTDRGGAG
jgi:hypothetical protein